MGWHTPALLQAHLTGGSLSPGSAQPSGHTFSRPETPVPTAKQYMPESCPGHTSLNYRGMANTEQFRFITHAHAAAISTGEATGTTTPSNPAAGPSRPELPDMADTEQLILTT